MNNFVRKYFRVMFITDLQKAKEETNILLLNMSSKHDWDRTKACVNSSIFLQCNGQTY
jgi:hypothetical protein